MLVSAIKHHKSAVSMCVCVCVCVCVYISPPSQPIRGARLGSLCYTAASHQLFSHADLVILMPTKTAVMELSSKTLEKKPDRIHSKSLYDATDGDLKPYLIKSLITKLYYNINISNMSNFFIHCALRKALCLMCHLVENNRKLRPEVL